MLKIANLSHTYANGTVALEDVSLSIPRGMFGLLGPNGAGKSTLMRTMATLQEPTPGAIRSTASTSSRAATAARTLGYLPQDFGVYPRVSAYAMLDHLAVLKGITDASRAQERRRDAAPPDQPLGCAQASRSPASPAACASASASRRR